MRASSLAAVLIGLGLAAASCAPAGEDGAPPADAGAPRSTEPAGRSIDTDPPDAPGPVSVARPEGTPTDTIVLTSRGPELAFLPDRVSAKSGSFVLLQYRNGGDLPHNFVLVRNEEAIDALVTAAYEAVGTGYVPTDMRDDLIAFSPLVSPGGSVDLEVVIPPPGEYTYICLFPGHSQMMLGTLRSLP